MVKDEVIYEKTQTGYSAYLPDLPGCVAAGETKKQVEENIYEAIKFHLEGLREEV
jgi:predicted RNase H-like HicB family nuclease